MEKRRGISSASCFVSFAATHFHFYSPRSMCKLLSLTIALSLSASMAAAQTPDSVTYKHQLGLTASPQLDKFFKTNRSLPLGLIYKRQVKLNQALRARLVGRYRNVDTTNTLGYVDGTSNRLWELSAFGGYEWQKKLGNRLEWYYGAELGTGWSRQESHIKYNGIDERGPFLFQNSFIITKWQVQARPFLGLQFKAFSNVRIFVESAAPLSYQRRRDEGATVFTPLYEAPPQYPGVFSSIRAIR